MTSALPSYRARFVQLTALWAYGVSAPLLVVIDGNPDLILSRDLSRLQIALFAVGTALLPPALALAYTRLAAVLSTWVANIVFLVTVGTFLVPLAIRLLKPLDTGMALTLLLAASFAVAGTVLYARSNAARLFLAYSIVLPIAGLVWFVHGAPSVTSEASAATVRADSPVPVVMLVFDEMPASSLMTRDAKLDSVRYPAFGRLAREATWYPNATTVHEWTSDAVPSILTGQIGRASTLPTVEKHPENLFTLLGGQYTVDAQEYGTRLCPQSICRQEHPSWLVSSYGLFRDGTRLMLTRTLPNSLSGQVFEINFDISLQEDSDASLAGFDRMVGDLRSRTSQPQLFYSHVVLPHAPFRFLPSGERYDFRGMDGWIPDEHWTDDSWAVLQGYQRHLLQIGYSDRILGELETRLRRTGLWDRALVVVVADHGASFRAGQGRRPLTGDNLADITNVPLFVKYPGQHAGRVDTRSARTIDVVPTIADVVGMRLPWKVDGASLLGKLPSDRDVTVALRGNKVMHAAVDAMIEDRKATLAHKDADFGSGADSVYRIGDNRWILGKNASGFTQRASSVQIQIDSAPALAHASRASGFVPVRITGHVRSGSIAPDAELAVAVNGRVEALTRTLENTDPQRFRALVPESAIRDGFNRVDVFLISGRGEGAKVVWVGSNGAKP